MYLCTCVCVCVCVCVYICKCVFLLLMQWVLEVRAPESLGHSPHLNLSGFVSMKDTLMLYADQSKCLTFSKYSSCSTPSKIYSCHCWIVATLSSWVGRMVTDRSWHIMVLSDRHVTVQTSWLLNVICIILAQLATPYIVSSLPANFCHHELHVTRIKWKL